jgi:hypothetical protein
MRTPNRMPPFLARFQFFRASRSFPETLFQPGMELLGDDLFFLTEINFENTVAFSR